MRDKAAFPAVSAYSELAMTQTAGLSLGGNRSGPHEGRRDDSLVKAAPSYWCIYAEESY